MRNRKDSCIVTFLRRQYSVVITRLPGIKTCLYQLPAGLPWTSYIITLCPSFLIWSVGTLIGSTPKIVERIMSKVHWAEAGTWEGHTVHMIMIRSWSRSGHICLGKEGHPFQGNWGKEGRGHVSKVCMINCRKLDDFLTDDFNFSRGRDEAIG